MAVLQARATEMRRNPTEPEKRLWRVLSNGQVDGHKFRRQSAIGWFIADFLCAQKALIVEVDGDTHDEAKDRLRDDILGERGFRVLRVTNLDVMTNIEGVWEVIRTALTETPDRWPNSLPPPLQGRAGEGNVQPLTARSTDLDIPHPNPSPEGEGLKKTQKLLGISLEGSVG